MNCQIVELDPRELIAVCGGQEAEAGSGDLTVSCCSYSVLGFEVNLDAFSVTFSGEDSAEYLRSEGERQQELGTSQAGR